MYKFLLSTIFLSILVLSSCSSEQPYALTESDVEEFLQMVELEDKTLGPIVSSAYWIGANFITYDSQKVVADYGKRYQLALVFHHQFYIFLLLLLRILKLLIVL